MAHRASIPLRMLKSKGWNEVLEQGLPSEYEVIMDLGFRYLISAARLSKVGKSGQQQ